MLIAETRERSFAPHRCLANSKRRDSDAVGCTGRLFMSPCLELFRAQLGLHPRFVVGGVLEGDTYVLRHADGPPQLAARLLYRVLDFLEVAVLHVHVQRAWTIDMLCGAWSSEARFRRGLHAGWFPVLGFAALGAVSRAV